MKNYIFGLFTGSLVCFLIGEMIKPVEKHYSVIDLNIGVYESHVFTNKAAAMAKLIEFQNSLDTNFHKYTIVEVK